MICVVRMKRELPVGAEPTHVIHFVVKLRAMLLYLIEVRLRIIIHELISIFP